MAALREMLAPEKMAAGFRRAAQEQVLADANNAGPFLNPPPGFRFSSAEEAYASLPLEATYQSKYGGRPVPLVIRKLYIYGVFDRSAETSVLTGTCVVATTTTNNIYDWEEIVLV